MNTCRYCEKPIEDSELATTHGYWGGTPFPCHNQCKLDGEKSEAFDCQQIDADCNDCKHFKRGQLQKEWLSDIIDGEPGKRLVNMGWFDGHCLKFNKPTVAQPKMWTGRDCFEHRRAA